MTKSFENGSIGASTIGKKRKLASTKNINAMVEQKGRTHGKRKSGVTSHDESDIFQSLGSSVRNMDEYEQGVLKSAELDDAPRLTGIGFPNLLSLAPSGRAISDLSHFQTILTNVRQQIIQQPHNLSLLLQQQMLLNAIHTATNDFDKCLRPQEEFRHEQIRRQRFQRQRNKDSFRETQHRKEANISLVMGNRRNSLQQPAKSSLRGSSMIKKESGMDAKLQQKKEEGKNDDNDDETAAASRLENIKQQKTKSVSFATASATAGGSRRRVGLQKRRLKEQGNKNEEFSEETEEELERRRRHLRKLRVEREKRREKRRKRWASRNGQKLKNETQNVAEEDDEEKEFEFTSNENETKIQDSNLNQDSVTANSNMPPVKEETPVFEASCPLCQSPIVGTSQAVMDELLSQHLVECQTSRRRTRGSRQSPRRATRQILSYKEEGEDNTFGESEEEDAVVVSVENEDEDENLLTDETRDPIIPQHEMPTKKLDTQNGDEISAPTSLDDFDERDYEDRVDDWIENGIDRMRVMKEQDEMELPPGEAIYDGGLVIPGWVNDRLFPYQRTGLQWMWELHRQQAGGIIGDEMGLGKTVQLCAFLGSMAASRKLKSILIISPATILQHWLSELKVWAPGIRRILIHQSAETGGSLLSTKRTISNALLRNVDAWLKESRRHRLFEAIDEEDYVARDSSSFCGTSYAFITTYENLRRNPEIWTRHSWSYIIMDEAQKIRNPDADITLACKRLRTPHRIALSGTPIQNDLRELWSLFDFVFPGRLGTLPAFENEFADPIKRGGYSNASPMQVQLAYRCALVLRDLINPYLLRRLKKDIKEVNRMPGKKEQVLFCRLSQRQRLMYEAFLQSDQVKSVLRGTAQMLGAITTLRKICNHPDLVCPPDSSSLDTFMQKGTFTEADMYTNDYSDDDFDKTEGDEESLTERSGKLEVLAKILPLWKEQGHRVLIFCQWTKMLNIIQRFTQSQGWKFGRLDGKTNVGSRQRLVDQFNSDESFYGMLMTTQTGGVGLNLTGADRIILYDPSWNPQTDAQARERAWRFGQEREVTIYRLIAAGTVEEKIYQRQIFKTALSNRILQDPRQKRLFSQKDLKDLFTLRVDEGSVVSGSEGITETGVLTKGEGHVDPDEGPAPSTEKSSDLANEDNSETMRSVFASKGLAGVFDHDLVESNKRSQKASVREMEENARKVAKDAAAALKKSVSGHDAFTPTWTGTKETEVGRFGGGESSGATLLFGKNHAGIVSFALSSSPSTSSKSLLGSIRKRTEAVEKEGNEGVSKNSAQEYTALLQRIRTYVRRQAPTSEALLEEFSSVKTHDAAVFRRLLKSVARIKDGRWRLKES